MSSSPVMATMGTAKVRGAKVGHLDRDVGRVALLQRFGLLQHHVVVVRRQFYATVRGHGDDGELVICWPPPAMVTYWSNPALAAPSVLTPVSVIGAEPLLVALKYSTATSGEAGEASSIL
jgi:hypothetical protein